MGNSVMLNGIEYAGEQIAYKDSTYELVSKVAYLIGVPLRIFQNEHEPPKIEIYNRLEQDKNARIIRNLCIIRTAIERNYRKINDIMRMEYRGLLSMPEILPTSSMQQLSNDGISFIKKSSTKLCHHIIEINRLISDRINNCKSLFPIWINWAYIKELFIMPNGLTEDGTKDAADIYYASLSYYPYQMYINWVPMDEGNVLYNDKKFATLLYQWHCDAFTEYSKVSDAGAFVKNNIYDFIDDSEKTVLNSVYTRSGQNSTPNSNATNLHSSQKRCCSFCISSSNASPTFQVQKSIFHQMTKPIQVTVILPLLLAISFSRNDDIHSSISGISNDLIGVIPTIGQ